LLLTGNFEQLPIGAIMLPDDVLLVQPEKSLIHGVEGLVSGPSPICRRGIHVSGMPARKYEVP
jgi:hypothetical protein